MEQVLLTFILRSAMEPISCLGTYMRPTLPSRLSAPTFFSCVYKANVCRVLECEWQQVACKTGARQSSGL